MLLIGVVVVVVIFLGLQMIGSSGSVARKSLQNLARADSFHTKADLTLNMPVNVEGGQRPIVEMDISVEGDVGYQENIPVLDGDMRMEARGRGMILFADGDVVVTPETVAFYLNDLPALLNPKGNLVEKWTHVEAPLLTTNNPEEITEIWEYIFRDLKKGEGGTLTRSFTPEEEEQMIAQFQKSQSGNEALHVLARLLDAFDITDFTVDVNGDKELEEITVVFANEDGQGANLALSFTDYNTPVTVELPKKELTVRSEVFRKIFGSGTIRGIQ